MNYIFERNWYVTNNIWFPNILGYILAVFLGVLWILVNIYIVVKKLAKKFNFSIKKPIEIQNIRNIKEFFFTDFVIKKRLKLWLVNIFWYLLIFIMAFYINYLIIPKSSFPYVFILIFLISIFINIYSIIIFPIFLITIFILLVNSFLLFFVLNWKKEYKIYKKNINSKILEKFNKIENNIWENKYYLIKKIMYNIFSQFIDFILYCWM